MLGFLGGSLGVPWGANAGSITLGKYNPGAISAERRFEILRSKNHWLRRLASKGGGGKRIQNVDPRHPVGALRSRPPGSQGRPERFPRERLFQKWAMNLRAAKTTGHRGWSYCSGVLRQNHPSPPRKYHQRGWEPKSKTCCWSCCSGVLHQSHPSPPPRKCHRRGWEPKSKICCWSCCSGVLRQSHP